MPKKRYRKPKKLKMHSITEKFVVAGLILGCVLLLIFSLYMILRGLGKSNLYKHANEVQNEELQAKLQEVMVDDEDSSIGELKEGEILYQGEVYALNEDIMTFLCMGIDSRSGITDVKTPGKAGQADAILLVIANPHTKKIDVLSVNRDSMTDVEVYDTAGGYAGTKELQITLQYAYGDGKEKSCELMEQAVSRLLYGIPIHGYISLDMEAIPTINDAVGGVTLNVLEDMTWCHEGWTEGREVMLTGKDALVYIQRRNINESGTNLKRIARQKQYLSKFAQQFREATKKDITFPINLYGDVQKHVVTSFTVDEMTYLAGEMLGYSFTEEGMHSMEGELKMGKKNEEFYPDEEYMKNLIVELFYEKVE